MGVALLLVTAGTTLTPWPATGQSSGQPTVAQPVQISVEPSSEQVAPGQQSALTITFRVPKYIWLGAKSGQDRTPPGTKIEMPNTPTFQFQEPIYPDPSVEGVPVHVGVTRVYKGEVTVIVPFRVADDAQPGEHEVTARLTYTAGFNACQLPECRLRAERRPRPGWG